jgi:hypothetical protein
VSRICVHRKLSALGWKLGMSDLTATKFNDCMKLANDYPLRKPE